MTDLSRNIHRVFAAACLGDALGAPTEAMDAAEIRKVFGGIVESLHKAPPKAPFAVGLAPGKLTDDATQMLAAARHILKANGNPTFQDAVDSLIDWASDPAIFALAGPTTRAVIEQLRAGMDPKSVATPATYSCSFGTSNGAAMRAPAAGCARPGDVAGAAKLAVLFSAPTHNTQIAFGGAAALAGSIAAGLGGSDIAELGAIADAAAAAGEAETATMGRVTGGGGVRRRIALALEIGAAHAGDVHGAAAELTEIVGNGLPMYEAVPHAFGLVAAAKGDPWQAILGAVNGGNDSDTIALFAGSVAASFWRGADPWPAELLAEIEAANGIDLSSLAVNYAALTVKSGVLT